MLGGFSFGGANDMFIMVAVVGGLAAMIYFLKLYKKVLKYPVQALVLEKHGGSYVPKMDALRLVKGKMGDQLYEFKKRDKQIDPIPFDKFIAPYFVILVSPNRETYVPMTIHEAAGNDQLRMHIDDGTINALIRRNEKNVMRFSHDDMWTKIGVVLPILTVLICGVVFVMVGSSIEKISLNINTAMSTAGSLYTSAVNASATAAANANIPPIINLGN